MKGDNSHVCALSVVAVVTGRALRDHQKFRFARGNKSNSSSGHRVSGIVGAVVYKKKEGGRINEVSTRAGIVESQVLSSNKKEKARGRKRSLSGIFVAMRVRTT